MKLNPSVHSAGKTHAGGVVCAVLMPHAPILVPEIGGERGESAAASGRAMLAAATCVVSHQPEAVVLISPHSPRQPRAFGLWSDQPLQGTFADFNAPQVAVSLPLDQPLARAIAAEARSRALATWEIHRCPLDHGALVPLWFLAEVGWHGPTVILSLNYPEADGLVALGEAIAAAASALPRRLALIASGDLSHRLTPGAPCGYHPQARQFDETFMDLVRAGDYRQLGIIAPKLRECAAEDAVDSTLIAAAAVNWRTNGHEVLNYEVPFGVGYGVAILFAEKSSASGNDSTGTADVKGEGNILPGLARHSVEAALNGSSETPSAPAVKYLGMSGGVFVTLRGPGGKLRGCIGTVTPVCPDIVAETWRNARLAAFQDYRFEPVTAGELARLRFDVSVLHPPEKISSPAELDPARYGVIVTGADGRHGLLLPGIEEIRTPEQQLRLARKKGGIDPNEPVKLQRFEVDHFKESD
jgi:AmmeMemoRadiSam system protein A/AmmeMemoRadiSam system protein B